MSTPRPPSRRRALFLTLALLIAAAAIIGFSVSLLLSALRAGERETAQALLPEATWREFATLPDDDAYPAALASAPDGTLFTGSFASGAIWRIDAGGRAYEIPGTRDALYSVSGLTLERGWHALYPRWRHRRRARQRGSGHLYPLHGG